MIHHWQAIRVFQNLQADQREVLMEGPQAGRYEVHQ
jgi:hypothetical protein